MEWDELENALAWFASAPGEWIKSGKQNLSAAAEWIWGVLQGDFNEEQSNAQVITGMVISMIPGVDQICDVRDVVANCKKINEDTSNKWAWIGLVITLIGLFPVLGSLAKGCFKILVASSRKATLRIATNAADTNLWKHTAYYVEYGIQKLNQHLDKPVVRAALKAMRWDNPYKELAKKVREVAGKLNVGALTGVFDEIISVLRDLVGLIQRWGTTAMSTQAGQLLQMVLRIRRAANAKLAEVLKPVTDWLQRLARRLDMEADQAYRVRVDAINPNRFKRPSNAAELEAFRNSKPRWVDESGLVKNPPERKFIPKRDFPDMSDTSISATKGKYRTFRQGTIAGKTYPPGSVLYRVVDPASADNSICWMTESEFRKLKSKDDWRRYFAVWGSWNSNGEFLTYTVPPGKGLNAWEGVVGSQKNELDPSFILEGGARQIVLEPNDLDMAYMGKRRPTGWGYSTFGESVSLVGVPVLKNYTYQPRK